MNLPGTADILDELIKNRNVLRNIQREARPHSTGPTASSIGYCLQRQIRDLQEPENRRPFDPELLRRFEIGNRLEAMTLSAYRASGMNVEPPKGDGQWKLYDEATNVTARLDFLLVWPPKPADDSLLDFYSADYIEQVIAPMRESLMKFYDDAEEGYHSVELKTASSGSIKYRYREDKPMFTHAMQVGTEMWMAEDHPDQLPGPVRSWRIDYLGKDYAGVLPFYVGPDSADEARSRCKSLADLIAVDTPWNRVPCECSTNGDASFCSYLDDVQMDSTPKLKKEWTVSFSCCAGNGHETRIRRGPQDDRLVEEWANR